MLRGVSPLSLSISSIMVRGIEIATETFLFLLTLKPPFAPPFADEGYDAIVVVLVLNFSSIN